MRDIAFGRGPTFESRSSAQRLWERTRQERINQDEARRAADAEIEDAAYALPVARTTSEGYVYLRLPDHPLAARDDTVPRHRFVLYEAMGFKATRVFFPDLLCTICRWGGLAWKSTAHGDVSREVVNVDHINAIPGDDRVENLRPTCWWCNANRGWGEAIAPEWYERFCRWFAGTHPNSRPEMCDMVTEILGYNPRDLWKWDMAQEKAA